MLSARSGKRSDRRQLGLLQDAVVSLDEQSAEFGFEGAGYVFSPRPAAPYGQPSRPTSVGMHSRRRLGWWKDAYLKQEMWRIDPVYRAVLTTTLPLWWSYDARPRLVVASGADATAAQIFMFQYCAEATGIRSGLSIPMHTTFGVVVGYIVFATRAPLEEMVRCARVCEDSLFAAAHRFYHDVAHSLPLDDEHGVRLSSRELECLSLAAIGKTLDESALILGLSRSTVRFHLRNACHKLGAANRMQAVTKASSLGLLGPVY